MYIFIIYIKHIIHNLAYYCFQHKSKIIRKNFLKAARIPRIPWKFHKNFSRNQIQKKSLKIQVFHIFPKNKLCSLIKILTCCLGNGLNFRLQRSDRHIRCRDFHCSSQGLTRRPQDLRIRRTLLLFHSSWNKNVTFIFEFLIETLCG